VSAPNFFISQIPLLFSYEIRKEQLIVRVFYIKKQFWAWIVLSILGMDKVRSTAWKTYIRGCFGSGLLVSLESICLL
jgi:hypothetical protein